MKYHRYIDRQPEEATIQPLYHYCIVRRDLPTGVMAAQLCHAAGESTFDFKVPSGTYAVVLSVADEEELISLARRLTAADIRHIMIREPDLPWDNQAMTIGLFPSIKTKQIKSVLSSLKLYR